MYRELSGGDLREVWVLQRLIRSYSPLGVVC